MLDLQNAIKQSGCGGRTSRSSEADCTRGNATLQAEKEHFITFVAFSERRVPVAGGSSS